MHSIAAVVILIQFCICFMRGEVLADVEWRMNVFTNIWNMGGSMPSAIVNEAFEYH